MGEISTVLSPELVEVIDTLGRRSILASCTQLQFTCQSTLSLRYRLRYRNGGRHTVL